jgi:hypothetical protein
MVCEVLVLVLVYPHSYGRIGKRQERDRSKCDVYFPDVRRCSANSLPIDDGLEPIPETPCIATSSGKLANCPITPFTLRSSLRWCYILYFGPSMTRRLLCCPRSAAEREEAHESADGDSEHDVAVVCHEEQPARH